MADTLALDVPLSVSVVSQDVPPIVPALIKGLAGWLLLGWAAAAGASTAVALHVGPYLLAVAGLPVLATVPSLLVAQQALGLEAAPRAVVSHLVRGVAEGGHLAAGLAPFVLFFALTTERWGLVLCITAAGAILRGLGAGARALRSVDDTAAMAWLARGWAILTGVLALRVAFLFSDWL